MILIQLSGLSFAETNILIRKPAELSKAYEVQFSQTKFTAAKEKVFNFFKEEFDDLNNERKSNPEEFKKFGLAGLRDIGIDLYNLDGDGIKEIIANPSAYPTFCWGAGCTFYIFKQDPKSGAVRQIFEVRGQGALFVGPENKNGYKVIKYYNDVPASAVSVWFFDQQKKQYLN